MKWPRGKYNGRRITGVEVRSRFDVLWWSWDFPDRYGSCLSVGPLHVWFLAVYDDEF